MGEHRFKGINRPIQIYQTTYAPTKKLEGWSGIELSKFKLIFN